MAVVLIEGFDHFSATQFVGTGKWTGVNASGVVAGRIAGQAATFINPQTLTKSLPSSYSTIIAGFGFRVGTSTPVAQNYFNFQGAAANIVRLNIATSGADRLLHLSNVSGTTLATGTTNILASTWYYIEIRVVVHASTGEVELRLNGSSSAEASATGVNTGSTNIDAIRFQESTGSASTLSIDDLYVLDTSGSAPTNTFLGDCRVETLAPDGNGTNTAWTGTYTDWDDSTAHDTDTTYISSSTPSDKETSTLGAVTSAGASVYAVQTNLVARKDDTGTRTIAPVLRVGGTDYDGTTTAALTTTYNDYTQLYDRLDPSGATWTGTTLNAMEAGIKVIA